MVGTLIDNEYASLIAGNGGVLSMRMQIILDSLFTRPNSAPIGEGKKREFRDWTRTNEELWRLT